MYCLEVEALTRTDAGNPQLILGIFDKFVAPGSEYEVCINAKVAPSSPFDLPGRRSLLGPYHPHLPQLMRDLKDRITVLRKHSTAPTANEGTQATPPGTSPSTLVNSGGEGTSDSVQEAVDLLVKAKMSISSGLRDNVMAK